MKYERFEQLPAWQAAMTLAEKAYALTDHRAFARLRELKDQLRRAALSISNNIAEGFERGTTAELLAFLYIARGSAGEVRSMLIFCQRLLERQIIAERQPVAERQVAAERQIIAERQAAAERQVVAPSTASEISDLKSLASEISDLKSLAESCSRQIRGWADHLQNTDIQGQRRLNDKTRQAYQAGKSAEAFSQKLQGIRDAAKPSPPQETA